MHPHASALADDACEFGWLPDRVAVASTPPTPLSFLRDHVAVNQPLLMRGALRDCAAMNRWTDAYLVERVGELPVHVNYTPAGLGDHVTRRADGRAVFAMPLERVERFADFLARLQSGAADRGIPYLSKQNGSLTADFAPLVADVGESWPLADAALGRDRLDALNLWIGDGRSVSTMHKDPYENIYGVVRGAKIFHLYPPALLPALGMTPCIPAEYTQDDATGEWAIAEMDGAAAVDWIERDPTDPAVQAELPAPPLEVRVEAGDVLYLPAYWLHRVAQEGVTVAVNWWYDVVDPGRFVFVNHAVRLASAT